MTKQKTATGNAMHSQATTNTDTHTNTESDLFAVVDNLATTIAKRWREARDCTTLARDMCVCALRDYLQHGNTNSLKRAFFLQLDDKTRLGNLYGIPDYLTGIGASVHYSAHTDTLTLMGTRKFWELTADTLPDWDATIAGVKDARRLAREQERAKARDTARKQRKLDLDFLLAWGKMKQAEQQANAQRYTDALARLQQA